MKNSTAAKIIAVGLILALAFSACSGGTEKAEYNGNSEEYSYMYEEGRNRAWEVDIMYFADMFLKYNPQISGNEYRVTSDYTDNFYYSKELYSEEMRGEFIENINLLIPKIDELSDQEIVHELRKTAVALGEAHSGLSFFSNEYFYPLEFEVIYNNGEAEYYAVCVPVENEETAYAKLESINGVPVDKIIEDSFECISGENIYGKHSVLEDYIRCGELLRDIGVIEKETDEAEFVFVKDGGEKVSCVLSPKRGAEYFEVETTATRLLDKGTMMYKSSDYYWYEILNNDTLYIRIDAFYEMEYQTFSKFIFNIQSKVNNDSPVTKTIVDLRDNPGGSTLPGCSSFAEVLNGPEFGNVYVLINGDSVSNAVLMATSLKLNVEGAVLVGSPAAEPPNFTVPPLDGRFKMSYSKSVFSFGRAYFLFWPGYEHDALMPDIEIYQTIEDYRNGTDTVLEAVFAME